MCNTPIPIDPVKARIHARPWRVVETAFGDVQLASADGHDIVTQAACWRDEAQFICDVVNAAYAEEQLRARAIPVTFDREGFRTPASAESQRSWRDRIHTPRSAQRAWDEERLYEVESVEGADAERFTAKRRRDLEVQAESRRDRER